MRCAPGGAFNCTSAAPGNGFEHGGDFRRLRVQHIQVVAENIHDHLRGLAGNGFADAIAEKGQHLGLHAGKRCECLANIRLHRLLLVRGRRLQFDVKLGHVRAEGILARFRAADLLLDGGDMRILQDLRGDLLSEPHHFRQRSAGHHLGLRHKMPLAKFRQQFAAEERQHRHRPREEQHGDGHGEARVLADDAQARGREGA